MQKYLISLLLLLNGSGIKCVMSGAEPIYFLSTLLGMAGRLIPTLLWKIYQSFINKLYAYIYIDMIERKITKSLMQTIFFMSKWYNVVFKKVLLLHHNVLQTNAKSLQNLRIQKLYLRSTTRLLEILNKFTKLYIIISSE